MIEDTIAAVSTAKGKGGVAMIRISGPDALEVAKRVFRTHGSQVVPRRCLYGDIIRENEIIDDGTLTYFAAPHSYTGEDVCEICCHGGIYVTSAVLEAVLSSGARIAGAGEFTRRAYINGKLTLSRAEAVGGVIDAVTDNQLKLSSSQERGVLSAKISEIREIMLAMLSRSYATIDYPDEDIEDLEREEMRHSLDKIVSELENLKKSYRAGRAIAEGIKTSIAGKPNSGKSTLYNRIFGSDVSIVTDIEGTTRDIIEHTVSLGGVTLSLSDTAGIRETTDTVEKIGVERAKSKINDAELVICVFDASTKESTLDDEIISLACGKSAIAVINKCDKEKKISPKFEKKIKDNFRYIIYISAKTGEGVSIISETVAKMYDLSQINISSDAVISNARQHSSVKLALDGAKEAREALISGESNDIVCYSLERALAELEMIDSRNVSEEIVDEIFSHFCVGK